MPQCPHCLFNNVEEVGPDVFECQTCGLRFEEFEQTRLEAEALSEHKKIAAWSAGQSTDN